jgi:protein-tyrosine phosphatase
MLPFVYGIPLDAPSSLYVMPKPSVEWLQEDIVAYRHIGMGKIISLLTREEADKLGLAAEAQICRCQGIDFLQHPIPDRAVADKKAFAVLAGQIHTELGAGRGVGIHCRAGIGRSGMLACCALTFSHRFTADEAIGAISNARGVPVPYTDEQTEFIREFYSDRSPSVC